LAQVLSLCAPCRASEYWIVVMAQSTAILLGPSQRRPGMPYLVKIVFSMSVLWPVAAQDEHGSTEAAPKWIYVGELALVIVLSIGFDLLKDRVEDGLKEMGRKGALFQQMLDVLFSEIMVLGFISLLVYVATKTNIAMSLAAMIYPSGTTITSEENPLSETFEKVHMIIFCVMLNMIFNCGVLIYRANAYSCKYKDYEYMRIRSSDTNVEKSMESMLVNAGYLGNSPNGTGSKVALKNVHTTVNPARRIFQSGGIVELMQWRLIRHEFMFPTPAGSIPDEPYVGDDRIYVLGEPQFFHFHEYLSIKLVECFMGFIEVSFATWCVAMAMSMLFPPIAAIGEYWYATVLACLSWLIVLVTFCLGLHIYDMYYQVTPQLPEDPIACLKAFTGTSATALRSSHRKRRRSIMSMESTPSPVRAEEARAEGCFRPTTASKKLAERFNEIEGSAACKKLAERFNEIEERLLACELQTKHSAPGIKTPREAPTDDLSMVGRFGPAPFWRRSTVAAAPRPKRAGRLLGKVLAPTGPSLPNPQELLFPFMGERGYAACQYSLALSVFFQSILNALYVALWFGTKGSWDVFQWMSFAIGLCAPVVNLWWLLTHVASKLTIISSIEFMKDKECIEEVMLSAKRAHVVESLQILEIAQMQSRLERLIDGRGNIDSETYSKYKRIYNSSFSEKKKAFIRHTFRLFDEDRSGSISTNELTAVLASMGFGEGSAACLSIEKLTSIIDADGSGEIDLEEFEVLMAMTFSKEGADESADGDGSKALFERFDRNGDGVVSIKELAYEFGTLGVDVDENCMLDLVNMVTGSFRQGLDKESFIKFMTGLEELTLQ